MTKKDYQLLVAAQVRAARTLRDKDVLDVSTFVTFVDALADALASDNRNFDRDKFYSAIMKGVRATDNA